MRLKADQLATLCPCSKPVVVEMSGTSHLSGIGEAVRYSGTCWDCGRVQVLTVQAHRSRLTVKLRPGRPVSAAKTSGASPADPRE